MNLQKAEIGASSKTHQEHIKVRHLVYAIKDLFSAHDAEVSPSVALRVEGVPDAFEPAPPPVALLTVIGKARERLRKAIKELEDHYSKAGTPIQMTLPKRLDRCSRKPKG